MREVFGRYVSLTLDFLYQRIVSVGNVSTYAGALCVTWRKGTTAHTGSGKKRGRKLSGRMKEICFFEDRKE